MRIARLHGHIFLTLSLLTLVPLPAAAQEAPPSWAYHFMPEGPLPLPAIVDNGAHRRVPGSDVTMTLTQTRDRFNPPDWHPASHPPMPEPVRHGRQPNTYACALCHRAEGQGGAENANISGLSKDYIVRQLQEMRTRARQTAADQRPGMVLKGHVTSTITDEEILAAASYFSSLPARSHLRVVEADVAPKVALYNNFYLLPTPDGQTEPLGQRIIETPDDPDRFESRDTRTTFTALVPKGSIERGRALAASGVQGSAPCASCHGEGLKGGVGPRLAGQFASYLVRQLHDYKTGKRKGAEAGQMAGVVEKLALPDMIALAAYAASLTP